MPEDELRVPHPHRACFSAWSHRPLRCSGPNLVLRLLMPSCRPLRCRQQQARWLSAPQYLQSASSCPSAPSGREPWTASSPPRRLCQGTARVTLEESCVCKSNQTCPSEDCGVLCCCVSTGNACPGVPGPVPASPSAPACGLPAPSSDRPHCPV